MGVVTVRFKSARQHLDFVAQMVNGQVKVIVNDVTPSSLQQAPARPDHEDDDDHDEEDEHHDEHHDEDHEDEDDD
jgi:hypothetical protein